MAEKNARAAYRFLAEWVEAGDKSTKWIIREGMKKLPKEWQEDLKAKLSGG